MHGTNPGYLHCVFWMKQSEWLQYKKYVLPFQVLSILKQDAPPICNEEISVQLVVDVRLEIELYRHVHLL
jgi:hypothetical protein